MASTAKDKPSGPGFAVDLLVHNALVAGTSPDADPFQGWLAVSDGCIAAVGDGKPPASLQRSAAVVADACGALLMPGAIDMHVHFREPGLAQKATIASESRAAAAGGVTSWVDMPNTLPPTVTLDAWEQKMELARRHSLTNYAFWLGATADNAALLLGGAVDYSRVAGIKVFYGASTGPLLLDDHAVIRRLLSEAPTTVAFHAEDNALIDAARRQALAAAPAGTDDLPVAAHSDIRHAGTCTAATAALLDLWRQANSDRPARSHMHLLHITTAGELRLLAPYAGGRVTAETCPHYLLFDTADYPRLGARIKCNPSVKGSADREALLRAAAYGLVDTLGSDHAPHLAADKQGGALRAASGMPGVQWLLPWAVTLLGPARAARMTAHAPARILALDGRGALAPGMKADMALLTPNTDPIQAADVLSPCAWTPYEGMAPAWKVAATWVNGTLVWDGRRVIDDIPAAQPLRFRRPEPNHAQP